MDTNTSPQTAPATTPEDDNNTPESRHGISSRGSKSPEDHYRSIRERFATLSSPHYENGVNVAVLRELEQKPDNIISFLDEISQPPAGKQYYVVKERLEEPVSAIQQDSKNAEAYLSRNGEFAIERLFRLNVYMARLELFKDYYRIKYLREDGLYTHMARVRENISQYAEAAERYDGFMQRSTEFTKELYLRRLKALRELDRKIAPIAKREVALEDLKTRIQNATLVGPPLTELVIDEKERDMWEQLFGSSLLESAGYREAETVHAESIKSLVDKWVLDSTAEYDNYEYRRASLQKRFEEGKQGLSAVSKFFEKLAVVVLAGLSLLVPMLIMVLRPTLLTRLLTTSIFIVVVSIMLTFAMTEAERKDVVAATAAYAAVLVVFVGTGEDTGAPDTRFITTGNITSSATAGNITMDTTAVSAEPDLSNWKIGIIVMSSILGTLVLLSVLWILWLYLAKMYDIVPEPIPGVKIVRWRNKRQRKA